MGWVFHLEFFALLHHAVQFKHKHPTIGLIVWEYQDPQDLRGRRLPGEGPAQYENKKRIKIGSWLIPTRWNQGCFDAVQLLDDCLRVVQVAAAKTHKLNIRFVRALAGSLVGMQFICFFLNLLIY